MMRHYSIGGSAFPEKICFYIIFLGSIIFSISYNCYVLNTQDFEEENRTKILCENTVTNVGNSELAENTLKMKYFRI